MRYKIITADSLETLEAAVNLYLAANATWEAVGQPTSLSVVLYAQAVQIPA